MAFQVDNLEWLRKLAIPDVPELKNLGPRLYKALLSIQTQSRNIEQQTNSDSNLHPAAPPPLDGMHVSAQNGIFHISLTHNAEIFRGVRYHVEYANNPNFTNPIPLKMHDAREWRGSLGNLNLHFRAAPSYANSAPAPWTYFGSQSSPTMVSGGGPDGPPLPALSQGSGTGLPGEGLQGPGTRAYRSATGAPPVRAGNRGTS